MGAGWPVAVNVFGAVIATNSVVEMVLGPVRVGAEFTTIVIERGVLPVQAELPLFAVPPSVALLEALSVKVKLPVVVGVPESTPVVVLKVMPGGKVPVTAPHVALAGLAAVNVKFTAVIAVPCTNVAGGVPVIVGAMF